MSTQEFSQWVVDGNLERSNEHNTLTYMPGQSGYVNLEDIELSITQHGTQVDITPHVESRSELFPENKRFIEPETPVPGIKNVIRDSSSDGIELQTPMLPNTTFDNPFGVDHDGDSGVMALSQIFKATQAPSSPNLPRQLPSSQRPSPMLLKRGPPIAGSETVVQQLSEPGDLLELIPEDDLASPQHPIVGSQTTSQRKRTREEDDDSSLFGEPNSAEIAWMGEACVMGPKRRRISETRHSQEPMIPESVNTKTPERISWKTARQTTSPQPDSKRIMTDEEVNTSEDETEHENVPDSDHIEDQDSDDDSNKENKVARQNPVLASGSNIRRAPQRLPNQAIPCSSSPVVIDPAFLQPLAGKRASPSNGKPNVSTIGVGSTEYMTIADSQSSPKVQPRLDRILIGAQDGSSGDSRHVVPQSQAVKPASSLHVTSTLAKVVSQQTVSPPDSTDNEESDRVLKMTPEHDRGTVSIAQNKPVSPRSSPPLPDQENLRKDNHASPKRSLSNLYKSNNVQGPFSIPDQQVRQPRQLQGQSAASRLTRSSSAIPETTYVNRRGNAYSASFPVPRGDPFAVAEDMEFGFKGQSQLDEHESAEHQPLAASFKSQRVGSLLQSPLRRSPRRPRTFSAIAGDMSTQEQDSLELDAVFTAEDQEIRDMLARMPASGSSPLDPVRKRRQRKAPVLLNQSSGIVSPQSQEAAPTGTANLENVLSANVATPEPQLLLGDKNSDSTLRTSESNREDALAPGEPTPSLEDSIPKQQYGRKASRQQLGQAKPIATQGQRNIAPKAPISKVSDKPPVAARRGRKSRTKSVTDTTTGTRVSTSADTVKPPKTSNATKPVAIQATHLKIPGTSTSPVETLLHNRVFAEFRGSPTGFFAATCTGCWKGEAELKYSIRFDDGTVDQLGQALVRRLELRVGDEIKVDRRQHKSSTFVVTGFGDTLDSAQLEQAVFPKTDIFGHTTVRVKPKPDGRKKSQDSDELEVSITELFFTRGMRSAFRDREYSHSIVNTNELATPTTSGPSSNLVSPLSRTRSTNKLNLPGSTLPESTHKRLSSDQPIVHADGLFRDIVFIFTNNPNIKQQTSDTIEHEGGTILKGQKDIEDLFETPEALDIDETEGDEEAQTAAASRNKQGGILIKSEFKNTRLAVLVADVVCITTKYYQALALGIPCVSSKWIIDCLQSRKLKSWRPYLLAAGESETLDATISQQLNLTHDEIDSCHVPLATLIARRAQWLRDASFLLVGNGGSDCEKRLGAYTFFAWILGAAEVVVATDSKTAEQYLAKGKRHFDWICIDNEKEKSSSRGDRKAKRLSDIGLHSYAKTGTGGTRLIDTRHVTESLILGSLVDAKEL